MKPQLALPVEVDQLQYYLESDQWWFEQKLDGERLMIVVDDNSVNAINRKGSKVGLDKTMNALFDLPGNWVFDGEYIDSTFWLFDLPRYPGSSDDVPFSMRREAVEKFIDFLPETDRVNFVVCAKTIQDKDELIRWCLMNRSEGIMLKNIKSPYSYGIRSKEMLKLKFWESCDAVVTEVGREGKRSCAVSLWDNGLLIDVGSVAVTESMLGRLDYGDVIEVKYLYAFPDTRRLYQPSFLRVRNDKDSDECSINQLKYLNKEVMTQTERGNHD